MKKLLLGLIFSASLVSAQDYQVLPIGPFGGLNNSENSYIIPSNQAQDLLNVDITDGGKSIKKREGYGEAYELPITTSPGHGAFAFFNDNGSDVQLYFNDTYAVASVAGGAFTNLITSGTFGATYQCVDSQGDAYCVATDRQIPWFTDGATRTELPEASTGTMIAVSRDRLAISGMSAYPNRIDFSKANDFTEWTIGGDPADPNQITITAPGSKITNLKYEFGRWVWFKSNSFGYILEADELIDWETVVVSNTIGTHDNASYYDNGILYFRGNDGHKYAWDGAYGVVKLSKDIEGTVNASQFRISNSWTQTSQSDFQSGFFHEPTFITSTDTAGSLLRDYTKGSVVVDDDSSSDFSAGTHTATNYGVFVSTGDADGEVFLDFAESEATKEQEVVANGTSQHICDSTYYGAVQFTASSSYVVTAIGVYVSRTGTTGGMNVKILSDDSDSPGDVLDYIAASAPGTTPGMAKYSLSSPFDGTVDGGEKYWIQLEPTGACDGSSNIISWHLNTLSSSHRYCFGSTCQDSTTAPQYRIYGRQRETSGDFLSQSFDTGLSSNTTSYAWGTLDVNQVLDGQTITWQVQSSTDNTTWSSLYGFDPGQVITTLPQRRYIRYKATLSGTPSKSPAIEDVRIRYGSKTYDSDVNQAENITSWDAMTASGDDSGGSFDYYIRSHPTVFRADSSTIAWTQLSDGDVPTVGTNSFFQFRAVLQIGTNGLADPRFDDFTLNWFEGNASEKAYVEKFEDAIWWAVASGDGQTTNNRILRFDLINRLWTVYDIPANGMLIRNNNLYFVSASTGVVYKFGDVDSDAGSSINAYWKSKDLFGIDPFVAKDYRNISIVAGQVMNSSVTVTYTLDGSSESSYEVDLESSTKSFIRHGKNLPQGSSGDTLSVQVGNNDADEPFEIFAIRYGFKEKAWRPD